MFAFEADQRADDQRRAKTIEEVSLDHKGSRI